MPADGVLAEFAPGTDTWSDDIVGGPLLDDALADAVAAGQIQQVQTQGPGAGVHGTGRASRSRCRRSTPTAPTSTPTMSAAFAAGQRATPDNVVGRVVAVSRTLTLLASLIAALTGGLFTARFGIGATIGVAAATLLVACPLIARSMHGIPLHAPD